MASTSTTFDTDCKLMLHLDGTDASTTFTDSSTSANTVTASGSAQIDTAQSKFGGASLLVNGGYISAPDSALWDIGTGDFTVDFWVRHNTEVNGRYFYAHGSAPTFGMRVVSGQTLVYIAGSSVLFPSETFTTGTWQHVAVTRSGTSLKLFIDGTEASSATNSSNITGGSTVFAIGAFNDGSNVHDGWIDEFRLVVGTAVWTANFTPPSAAYTSGGGGGSTSKSFMLMGVGA